MYSNKNLFVGLNIETKINCKSNNNLLINWLIILIIDEMSTGYDPDNDTHTWAPVYSEDFLCEPN